MMVMKLQLELSPAYKFPKVTQEFPEASDLRYSIYQKCIEKDQTTETTQASLQLFNRVVRFSLERHQNKESAKLATSLFNKRNLTTAAIACIHLASKYFEVMPYTTRERAVHNMESELYHKVFQGDISQTAPMTFINLIMGAWPEAELIQIEKLANIASMMCLLNKDLLPFRTSVLAVACLEITLHRLNMS